MKAGRLALAAALILILIASGAVWAQEDENGDPSPVAVESVSLSLISITLTEGESEYLEAIINPPNATNKNVDWSSSDEEVATVEANSPEAWVTAVGQGTTVITAITEDGFHTATCEVTVEAAEVTPTPQTGISLVTPQLVASGMLLLGTGLLAKRKRQR